MRFSAEAHSFPTSNVLPSHLCLLNSGWCSFWAVCYDPPEGDDVFLEPCVVIDYLSTDPPPPVSASFGLCFMPSPPWRWIFRILQMLISKVWNELRILVEFVGWVCSVLSHYLFAQLWWKNDGASQDTWLHYPEVCDRDEMGGWIRHSCLVA